MAVSEIGAGDSRILTYTVRAARPGSYRLGPARVLYAEPDGNYHIAYSDTGQASVIAPLIPRNDAGSEDLFRIVFSWFGGHR